MNKNIIVSFAVTALFAAACNDNTSEGGRADGFSDKPVTKEDSLYKQVMDGHDEAMMKMGRIRKYLVQITKEKDSIAKLPAKQQDQSYQQTLATLEQRLSTAEQRMNNWMENFNIDSAKDNAALRIQYLQSESGKVDSVKNLVLESVQQADSLFKKP